MNQSIIATTLSGLFVRTDPWRKAHEIWFRNAAERLADPRILEWINQKDYFKGVDEVMQRLYIGLTEEQRTVRARELFFEAVCKYIQDNPQVRNTEIIDYFKELKEQYQIALITTNTEKYIQRILSLIDLSDFFDLIETSLSSEKDDKRIVFDRFIEKYGKPRLYIGGERIDGYDYCRDYNLNCLFANLEGQEDIAGVAVVHNIEELKEAIENLST